VDIVLWALTPLSTKITKVQLDIKHGRQLQQQQSRIGREYTQHLLETKVNVEVVGHFQPLNKLSPMQFVSSDGLLLRLDGCLLSK